MQAHSDCPAAFSATHLYWPESSGKALSIVSDSSDPNGKEEKIEIKKEPPVFLNFRSVAILTPRQRPRIQAGLNNMQGNLFEDLSSILPYHKKETP